MQKSKDDVRAEALEIVRKFKRSSVVISMGVGKTRLGLDHFQLVVNKVQRDNSRMARGLVVAPTKKILEGWKAECIKWGLKDLLKGLKFTTYRSLIKHNPSDFDSLYLDECHSIKQSHSHWLSIYTGYTLGLTGTPPKFANSEKGRLINAYCPIKYEYLVKEAVNDKILNDYEIIVHMLTLSDKKNHKIEIKDPKTQRVIKRWYTSEIDNYNYWTKALEEAGDNMVNVKKVSILRMKAMQVYSTKEEYAKRLLTQAKDKCILFANTQEQADKLCNHSYHAGNPNSAKNIEMFENNEITELSAVQQLSEGANIKGLKEVIIMHSFGNNRTSAQRIARGFRLDPEDKATMHILCYKDTIDKTWTKTALEDFDQDKIFWYDPDEF